MDAVAAWYDGNRKHSGIALFSPNEVRDIVQQAYDDAHPERLRYRPRTPAPAGHVGISQPKPEPEPQAA
jgi:putative transposase